MEAAASRLGLEDSVRVVCSDGMTALHESLVGVDGTVVAHIDPYDPWAQGPAGVSTVGLARELIQKHHGEELFGATAELTKLAGWMAYDDERHGLAQRYLILGDELRRLAEQAYAQGGAPLDEMAEQAVTAAVLDRLHGLARLQPLLDDPMAPRTSFPR